MLTVRLSCSVSGGLNTSAAAWAGASPALRTVRSSSAAAADSSPRMGSYNGPADFLMGVDRYTLVGKRIA